MSEELELIFQQKGDEKVKAYFKKKNGVKIYYDFQEISHNNKRFVGSYDILNVQELLYYIREQEASVYK